MISRQVRVRATFSWGECGGTRQVRQAGTRPIVLTDGHAALSSLLTAVANTCLGPSLHPILHRARSDGQALNCESARYLGPGTPRLPR